MGKVAQVGKTLWLKEFVFSLMEIIFLLTFQPFSDCSCCNHLLKIIYSSLHASVALIHAENTRQIQPSPVLRESECGQGEKQVSWLLWRFSVSKQPVVYVGTQRRGVQINLESGQTLQKRTLWSLFLEICLSIWMNKGVAKWHADWEGVITGQGLQSETCFWGLGRE